MAAAPGVGHQHVDPVQRVPQPVQVGGLGGVTLNTGRAGPELPDRGVQRLLIAAGDDHLGALGGEPRRDGQPDAGAAAGHHGHPARQLLHDGNTNDAFGAAR